MKGKSYLTLIGLVVALCLSRLTVTYAQKQDVTAPSGPNDSAHFHERYPRYVLRPGDVFDLGFEFSPEFNQTVEVQPDGFISLREVGDLHVSGLTFPEVQQAAEVKYGSILQHPIISLTPKKIEDSYFMAVGEVAHPGKYELRDDITVTEAIALAGGLNLDRARHSKVVLFRREGNTFALGKVINIKKMLNKKDLSEDVYIRPGDLLYVPQNTWSKTRPMIPTSGVGMEVIPGATF
ncbi:MAG: polysaccharide export protein [Acidobacteria bacterium]|nr:polysaccharide export protein [Acidobacteriota bacterium]